MWSTENTCYETPKPRQFDCVTWGCDISKNACMYAKKAGIYDEVDVLDLNKMSASETVALQNRCRNANILHINSLGYISDAVLLDIIDWFSEGTEPGMFNFFSKKKEVENHCTVAFMSEWFNLLIH